MEPLTGIKMTASDRYGNVYAYVPVAADAGTLSVVIRVKWDHSISRREFHSEHLGHHLLFEISG